jgi:hypothetical protein
MGLATVLLKGRVRAAGLRRRRHDWQTEEAKVRGLRKDAMVCVCVPGVGGGALRYAICADVQCRPVPWRLSRDFGRSVCGLAVIT